jgi:hypothetical protein
MSLKSVLLATAICVIATGSAFGQGGPLGVGGLPPGVTVGPPPTATVHGGSGFYLAWPYGWDWPSNAYYDTYYYPYTYYYSPAPIENSTLGSLTYLPGSGSQPPAGR